MKSTELTKSFQLWRFRWHFLFMILILAAAVVVVVSAIVSVIFPDTDSITIVLRIVAQAILSVAILTSLFVLMLLTYENVRSIKETGEKLDNLNEITNRNRNLLGQISQAVRLSDSAREIAFRDNERMELREAVLGKLHQHDFDATDAMIAAMARRQEYADLADQLKKTADQYRGATEDERIKQIVAYIDKLCQLHYWTKASVAINRFIKAFPQSELARSMPATLLERKNERKRQLLDAWDKAVKRGDTDSSLEILKELDLYLTPNEGLALQESASSVFRTKLHNLGVRFAMSVTEKQWKAALETGGQIVNDFPNSKMAHEIRGKMDVLKEMARQKEQVGG